MKLEGQDRERPGDDLTIFIGVPALLACLTAAWVCSQTVWSAMLAALIFGYCSPAIVVLLRADTERIRRGNQQMEEEIARLDADIARVNRDARLTEIERQAQEGE